MNPSEPSKPSAPSGSSPEEPAARDDSPELLIRVPLGEEGSPEEEQPAAAGPQPAAAGQQPAAADQPPPKGSAPPAGRRQPAAANQARPLFTTMAGVAPEGMAPGGVDRARSGPPPEPEAAARIKFARLHLRTGSLMTARVQYEALAASGDLDLSGLLDLAEVRWRTADLPGAGMAAAEYLSKDGDQALGFLIAAEAAARGGRQVEARRSAEIAAERLGKDLDAIFAGLPRRLNWAGVTAGPAPSPSVGIKIETPAKPGPEPAKPGPEPAKPGPEPAKPGPEPAKPGPEPARVSSEALWAQIVEVAQAADQAGEIADEKAEPKPAAEAEPKPAAEAEPKPEAEAAEPKPEAEAKPEAESAEPEPAAEAEQQQAAPEERPAAAARGEKAEPTPAPEPAPAAAAQGHPWDEAVAAGSAALEAADPLLAALHFAVALRMSPEAAPAVLAGIGDRRDLALELVRVDAIRVAAEADAASAPAEAEVEPQPTEPPAPDEPIRKAAPEPPPIRWE